VGGLQAFSLREVMGAASIGARQRIGRQQSALRTRGWSMA
jgi:hypothetical protein